MKTRSITAAFLLVLLLAVGINPLAGQTATGVTITKSNLKAALENLGYETKDLGADTYQITLVQDVSYPMSVALSKDESRIWLITFFGEKVLSNFTSDKLIKMLQSNRLTGVSFFALNGSKLEMLYSVENRNITPILLRKAIESQAKNVANTKSLWNDK